MSRKCRCTSCIFRILLGVAFAIAGVSSGLLQHYDDGAAFLHPQETRSLSKLYFVRSMKRRHSQISDSGDTTADTSTLSTVSKDLHAPYLRIGSDTRACWPKLEDSQWAQLEHLAWLLVDLNVRINVISRKDIQNVILGHIVPALGIARLLHTAPAGTKVLDIGTGGGLPGLPLAIACPQLELLLVDSVGKKIRAVQDMAEAIGLNNVKTKNARVEDLGGRYHYVVGRSVTALPRFLKWAKDKLMVPKTTISRDSASKERVRDAEWEDGEMPESGVLYITGLNPTPGRPDEQDDIEEAPDPSKVYRIGELLSAYKGDKVIMNFSAHELCKSGRHSDYDEQGKFRPIGEGHFKAKGHRREESQHFRTGNTRGGRYEARQREWRRQSGKLPARRIDSLHPD